MWTKIIAAVILTAFLILTGCTRGNISESGVDPTGDKTMTDETKKKEQIPLQNEEIIEDSNMEPSEEIGIDDSPITDEDIIVNDIPERTGNEM